LAGSGHESSDLVGIGIHDNREALCVHAKPVDERGRLAGSTPDHDPLAGRAEVIDLALDRLRTATGRNVEIVCFMHMPAPGRAFFAQLDEAEDHFAIIPVTDLLH
jgi:hypothetical protein